VILQWFRSRGSSVSLVSTDWTTGVRSPAGQRIFPLTSVSRPALEPTQPLIQWVPGVLSSGVKRGRGVMLTTHSHLVPRSWMSRIYTSSPLMPPYVCCGTALPLLLLQWFYHSNLQNFRTLKTRAFWDTTLCDLLGIDRRFRGVIHNLDDGGSTHLWNVDLFRDCTALYPRRLSSSYSPPWEPEISHSGL
jgi:hypothetical protein